MNRERERERARWRWGYREDEISWTEAIVASQERSNEERIGCREIVLGKSKMVYVVLSLVFSHHITLHIPFYNLSAICFWLLQFY